jgi:hypothetical protein
MGRPCPELLADRFRVWDSSLQGDGILLVIVGAALVLVTIFALPSADPLAGRCPCDAEVCEMPCSGCCPGATPQGCGAPTRDAEPCHGR